MVRSSYDRHDCVSVTIVVLILWSVLDPVPTGTPVPISEQSNVFPRVTTACGESYGIWASVIIFGVNVRVGLIALSMLLPMGLSCMQSINNCVGGCPTMSQVAKCGFCTIL